MRIKKCFRNKNADGCLYVGMSLLLYWSSFDDIGCLVTLFHNFGMTRQNLTIHSLLDQSTIKAI